MESLGVKLRTALGWFRSLSLSRRMTIAAVVGLVFLSLCLLIKSGSTSREYIFGGREFSRDELLAIESAFGDASLEDWQTVGSRVQVPASRKSEYLAALSSQKLSFGWERPSEKESFFPFGAGRDKRLLQEKQEKMARVVGGMPGIAQVAVVYTQSKPSGFPRKSEKRAVVAVKAVGGRHLDVQEVTAIRKAIVGSEAGLPAESVAVLDTNAKRTYDGTNDNSTLSTPQSLIAAQERIYEDQLRQKILNRLVNYRGLVVEVNAQPLLAPDLTSDHLRQQFLPHAIAVSIGVPSSYYTRLWKQRHESNGSAKRLSPSRQELASIEAETLQKIEEIVGGLLNEVNLPAARMPKVVVRTDEDFAKANEITQTDGQKAWALFSQRGRPLLIALTALILVAGWLVVSRKKRQSASSNLPLSEASRSPITTPPAIDEANENQVPDVGEFEASPSSAELQNQLSRLVQQDPDAAVDALRKWIKKVA